MGEVIFLKYFFKLCAYYLFLILKDNNIYSGVLVLWMKIQITIFSSELSSWPVKPHLSWLLMENWPKTVSDHLKNKILGISNSDNVIGNFS